MSAFLLAAPADISDWANAVVKAAEEAKAADDAALAARQRLNDLLASKPQ
jgi:hypothetical protein